MGESLDEEHTYNIVVGVSLALTIIVILFARIKHNDFVDDTVRGRMFYFIMGPLKMLIGILLLTVLHPGDCATFQSTYGYIAILLGIVWLRRGSRLASAYNQPTETNTVPMSAEMTFKDMIMDEESALIFDKADTLLARVGTCRRDAMSFIYINIS